MKKQLVTNLGEFDTWNYYSRIDNKLLLMDATDTPFICYPNRIPCYEANLYIESKLKQHLSRKVKGGTLKTYAMLLSHFIRFIFENNIKFTEMNDARFTMFIQGLQAERDLKGSKVRSNKQVIQIGRQAIDFMVFVSSLYSKKTLIGEEPFNAIVISRKTFSVKVEGHKNKIYKEFYSHRSLPTQEPQRKRHPISTDALKAIKGQILSQTNKHKRRRDDCIFQSLEQTGARRTEVSLIRVEDVLEARDSELESPLLRIVTLKRRQEDVKRFLPVPSSFIAELTKYINTTRRKVIKQTIGKTNDHGYLFVSLTTGEPLSTDTIATYMHTWRTQAGINDKAFSHLFRHRFITEKLKCIILEHDINNQDEFRKKLLNTERFKMQLREWTGHTILSSLDVYIDLVFADLAGVQKTYNAVTLQSSVDLMQSKIQSFKNELNKGDMTISELVEELNSYLDAFSNDIKRSIKQSNH